MAGSERGVYSPPPDDDYDARDSGKRGVVLLAVSLVVLCAAAVLAWSAYNLGFREGGREAPPRVVAETGPFRTEPADPGGFQAPDQDIEVYDTLTGESRAMEPNFAPPPEEPMEAALQPEEPAPAQGVRIIEADPAGPQEDFEVELEPDSAPPPAQPEPEPEPEPEPAPPPPPAASAGGAWLVQLAALRSEDEARATWSRVTNAQSSLMAGVDMDIQRADLGDRGIYYRLRAAAFQTKATADDFCARLKQGGQDCIVVSR